jgi:hypothetical protein
MGRNVVRRSNGREEGIGSSRLKPAGPGMPSCLESPSSVDADAGYALRGCQGGSEEWSLDWGSYHENLSSSFASIFAST